MEWLVYSTGVACTVYSAPVYSVQWPTFQRPWQVPAAWASTPGSQAEPGPACPGPEPGPGWENLENLATCSSQPVAPPPPLVCEPLANMVRDTGIFCGDWGNCICSGGTRILILHGLMSLSGVWTLAPRVSAILWLFDGSRPGAGAAW